MRYGNFNAREPISRHEDFTTHTGNLSGVRLDGRVGGSFGHLPRQWRERLFRDTDARAAEGLHNYIVLSYSTPIAWLDVDGDAVIPDVTYSSTTSHHQSIARHITADNFATV